MKDLMITNNELTMSSLEIANLTETRHDSTKRTIEFLVREGIIVQPHRVDEQMVDAMGRKRVTQTYVFSGEQGKRDSIVVVARISPGFTAALVDRWQELEAQNSLQLPNFNDPVEAARAWADQVEANQIAQKQLEEAKPKIEFVERYVDSSYLHSFRQVCKMLSAKENAFRAFLADNKIMYRLGREWMPYSQHLDAGRFEVKTGISKANGATYSTAYFTTKGVEWIAGLWARHNLTNEVFNFEEGY